MSVKTETKPTARISLFDAFGPNVSEEVDAITQRAAELSMADMVQVMGLPASGSMTLEEKVEAESALSWEDDKRILGLLSDDVAVHRLDTLRDDYEHLLQRAVYSGTRHFGVKPLNVKCEQNRRVLLEYLERDGVFGARKKLPIPFTRISRSDELLVQEAVDSVAANIQQLLNVGVDRRSITVAIKYQDPQTGVQRTQTVEDESSGSAGYRVGFKKGNQERKEPKTARAYFSHLHPATSKK